MEFADIETVAVVGAGRMGAGIAEVASLAGYQVTLRDASEELVEAGYERVEAGLDRLAAQERIGESDAKAALDRIEPVVDLERATAEAEVVVEAVPEPEEIKRDVYDELSAVAPREAVFVSSTASHAITALSEMTDRPERLCGMHFFDPPVGVQLVEVVAGDHTSEDTLEQVERLAEAFGKTPIRVRGDPPGFIVNRVLVPTVNEAAWLLASGTDRETIEATATHELGFPRGVFGYADHQGLDVVDAVLSRLRREEGDAYEASPKLTERVEAGELGHRTGQGFLDHEGDRATPGTDAGSAEVERLLLATMANEVAKLVGAELADPTSIDEALVLGGRFPTGPAKLADETGLRELVDVLEERHAETDHPRYEPAPHLRERATTGGFYEPDAGSDVADPEYEHVRVEYPRDGVGLLVIDRAHELNALTPDVLEDIGAAVQRLTADEAVRALVLTGSGEAAFAAGTDSQTVSAATASLDAVELARTGQRVLDDVETGPLPVVAAIEGYCLGGGLELAAAADLRIAGSDAEFGVPELNLGLMPGWGGTQRLPRIVGEGRAKELILTADRYGASEMADYGFLNEVVPTGQAEARACDLAAELAAGPPIAQRFVKRAIHEGRDGDASEFEAQAFGHLAGTEDAEEGLAASRSDREPEFEGR